MTDSERTTIGEQLGNPEQLIVSLEAKALRSSFKDFVREAWHLVEPSQPFVPNWHIDVMCEQLQKIAAAPGRRSIPRRWIFNIPPGTLKSLLICVLFPAWVWARNPQRRFLMASYGAHLTTRDNLRTRQLIESPWYQERFGVKLIDDQNTKTRYNTDKGGWRIATSVGGIGTGEHPHFVIIDDPTTAAQAESAQMRGEANGWFDRTISSRGITQNVVVIVVMQRLHMEDLTGHILSKKGGLPIEHVCFPMRYETYRPATETEPEYVPDPRDPRKQEGELLFPQLFTAEKVRQLELDLGPYGTAGQLQQRPSPEGGGLFKREWFKVVGAGPKLARRARGWDTAASENKGDWTVGVKIAEEFEYKKDPVKPDKPGKLVSTGRFYVEDVVRKQYGPADVDKLMLSVAEQDGKDVAQREEKEGGSAGKTVIMARAKLLVGHNYEGVNVGGSKVTRAKPFRSQCEAGNVFLVRGDWNEQYLTELANFPTGKHDDQVDSSSCAFNSVLLEEPPKKISVVWGSR